MDVYWTMEGWHARILPAGFGGKMNILRFSVENHSCFRDNAEISFVTTTNKDEPTFRIHCPGFSKGILPVIGVFGPNASGKSNLLQALISCRDHIRHSFQLQPGAKIPWNPWRLDNRPNDNPTIYCIDFVHNECRYQYGYSHNDVRFIEEWLLAWPKGKKSVLFVRNSENSREWRFGPSLLGEKVAISKATRPNSLFLSAAAHNNHEVLSTVHHALSNGIRKASEISLTGFPLFDKTDPIINSSKKDIVVGLLRAFDLGTTGFSTEVTPPILMTKVLEEVLKPDVLESINKNSEDLGPLYKLILEREDSRGIKWSLPSHLESSGTNVLLMRINDMLSMSDGIMVIDEIETSLHQELCVALIGQFTQSPPNKTIQLFFSTHASNLMSSLRRDEIVLVEKDLDGASSVKCVAEFKGIRTREKIEDLYSNGRVGALPILGKILGLNQSNA